MKKGEPVSILGKLNNRKYTDKNGNEKYITELVAYKIDKVQVEV